MESAPADDTVRQDVERWLHAIIDPVVAIPVKVAGRVMRCTMARADQVIGGPLAVVRSLVELAAGSPPPLVTTAARTDADIVELLDDPPLAPVDAPDAGSTADLPIDEYESLAASQVVARLPALTAPELRRIRRFEAANRGRRTILGKVDQLLPTT